MQEQEVEDRLLSQGAKSGEASAFDGWISEITGRDPSDRG